MYVSHQVNLRRQDDVSILVTKVTKEDEEDVDVSNQANNNWARFCMGNPFKT